MIFQGLVDFNRLYDTLSVPPIFINTMDVYSAQDKEALKEHIYTRYENDVMNIVPRCGCGITTGEANIARKCPECGTAVTDPMNTDLEPLLWMKPPTGVEKLINPIVWSFLCKAFEASGVNIIKWLTDRTYQPAKRLPVEIALLEDMGIPRGYNNFVQNFDGIMNALFEMKRFRKTPAVIDLRRFIARYRSLVVCNAIPVPNRSLLVIEDKNDKRILETSIIGVVNACMMMAGIDTPINSGLSINSRQNRTSKALSELGTEFYRKYFHTNLGRKGGLARKHLNASRMFFSIRAVITSITEPHHYKDMHIPWTAGIGALNVHLLNKLEKHGMYGNEAKNFLMANALCYHPLIDQLFQELIAEAPEGGIPALFCRNPSLMRGSIQKFLIKKVKTNVRDNTIGLSSLDIVALNADFDGDACSVIILLDNKLSKEADAFWPHKNTYDVNALRTVSGNVSIIKPVVAMISSRVITERELCKTTKYDQSAMSHLLV